MNPSPKKRVVVDTDNDYLKAIVKSFQQFIIDEATGALNADLTFDSKLKAARTLYESERKNLRMSRQCFGDQNSSNVELVFNIK